MDFVNVCEPGGKLLARATAGPVDGEGAFLLERVAAGKGRLLGYYFGRGNRAVEVESGDFRLRGSLRTSWAANERRWKVQMQPLTAAAAHPGNASNGSPLAAPSRNHHENHQEDQ